MSLRLVSRDYWFEIPGSIRTAKSAVNKIRGYQEAIESDFWSESVLEVVAVWGTPVVRSPRRTQFDKDNVSHRQALNRWVQSRLLAMRTYRRVPATTLLPAVGQKIFNHDLEAELRRVVSTVFLFKTGSHGDLHYGNMLVDSRGELTLTDLDCFQRDGTFEFDLFHLLVNQICVLDGTSWLTTVTQPSMNRIFDVFGHEIDLWFDPDFILFYTYVRACLETHVQGRKDRIVRCNRALNQLLQKRNGEHA